MKRSIVFALAVIAFLVAFAQAPSDSVKVFFHIGQWQFEPALAGNAESMKNFIDRVRIANQEHSIERIVVRSHTSPDGTERFNKQLSVDRCDAIARIIMEEAHISPDLIESQPQGVAWDELRRLVAATPGVPSREKILDIIDHTPIYIFDSEGHIIDGRKKQLMDLRGGRPYKWMFEHLFPALRNTVAVSLYTGPGSNIKPEDSYSKPESSPGSSGVISADDQLASDTVKGNADLREIGSGVNPDSSHSGVAETGHADNGRTDNEYSGKEHEEDTTAADSISTPLQNGLYTPYFSPVALKTNLLYYGILLPNLELEWLINKHWSVALEGNFAAWGKYENERSYRINLIDAEGRRWIKPRAPWHGFYVGLIAGGGWYDIEKGTPGHYGWGVMSGISCGFMWPIGRKLSLEAEIGAGYAYLLNKDYQPMDGHHVYMRTTKINYFGPIKLKFSLVWRFLNSNKLKRTTPAI